MLPSSVIDRIKSIQSKKEYDLCISIFVGSMADRVVIDEAIKFLKEYHPQYDDTNSKRLDILKDIKEGMADIDDING